jgi:hypothetical protein
MSRGETSPRDVLDNTGGSVSHISNLTESAQMDSSLDRREGIDRRKTTRYRLALPTQLKWIAAGSATTEEAISRDISIEGLFVKSMSALAVGSIVNVSVTLPNPGGAVSATQLKGAGSVVRRSEAGETTGLAIATRLALPERRTTRSKATRALLVLREER